MHLSYLIVGLAAIQSAGAAPQSPHYGPKSGPSIPSIPSVPSSQSPPTGASLSIPYKFGDTSRTDALAARAKANLLAYQKVNRTGTCSPDKIVVRREWNALNNAEKKAYLDANKCMLRLPTRSTNSSIGARNRWDDWTLTHSRQAYYRHGTGSFLSFHRLFLHSWEQALRNECGYKGAQPYVNWAKIAHDLVNAPMFDDSPYSIGGNGQPTNITEWVEVAPIRNITISAAGRGGCVTTGGMANMTINLGDNDRLDYNPRCLYRDLLPDVASSMVNEDRVYTSIADQRNISAFADYLQFGDTNNFLGIHAGGHFLMAGQPAGQFWISPSDPWFWLHHGQIDRVWWIWQNQELDVRGRTYSISGNRTAPPLAPAGLQEITDSLQMGTAEVRISDDQTILDTVSSISGPFCYIYE